jgi:T-complex protein 1 subunit theta
VTELELAKRVGVYGGKRKGQQRHVVKGFAMALEVIPRTLAENAAGEGGMGVNRRLGQNEPTDDDIEAKSPSDSMILANSNSLPYPILDSLAVKRCAIKLATEAAVNVLTIDNGIMRGGGPRVLTLVFQFCTSPLSNRNSLLDSVLPFSLGIGIGLGILRLWD